MANTIDPGSRGPAGFAELGLGPPAPARRDRQALGQTEFFDLMITQLKFQDPLKPVDNADFVAQMAQFSSVDALGGIQRSVAELLGAFQSNQALQASTLVGREVLIPGDGLELRAEGAAPGALELRDPGRTRVDVFSEAGALVATLDLGEQSPGVLHYEWDGRGADGIRLPPGAYRVTAEVDPGGGRAPVAVATLSRARVESVSLDQGPGGPTLNLQGGTGGGRSVGLGSVRELL